MESSVQLSGLKCRSCVAKITAALERLAGVESVEVSLDPPVARLESSEPVSRSEIDGAVRSAGDYNVVSISGAPPAFASSPTDDAASGSLYPLVLIVAYIAGTVAVLAWTSGTFTLPTFMNGFMGGFFLVFSFFKLLDLSGFAASYRTYDLVAAGWPNWGYMYPFIELVLGVAYVTTALPGLTNSVTLVLMVVGAVGVLKALLDKRQIRCACLGTVLKLPLTQVTLAEDIVMAVMAAVMLLLTHA